jgi:hypothetical protein
MAFISDDITVVQGSLGSGKSMVAVLEAIYQLKAGGVVACNFTFVKEWAWDLAGQDAKVWLGLKDRYESAESLWSRCFKIGSPESMIELSGERGSNLNNLCVGKRKNAREGKGLLILDDCHHFFNSRAYQNNKGYVSFFANARKYGWRTILITHSVENIDKQIRSYIEIEARFRNLQKVRIPFTPIPVSPFFPAFVIRRKYYGLGPGSGSNHSLDLFLMDKRAARLYDTLERFHADDVLAEYTHQGTHPSLYAPGRKSLFEQYKKPIFPKKEDFFDRGVPYHLRSVPFNFPFVGQNC